MPKPVHSSVRLDTEIKVRVSYSYQAQIRALAKSQKKTVSTLIRELLDREMDEHTFFKGAKWARDQQQVSEVWKDFKKSDLGNPIQLQSERPVQDTCKCDAATCEQYTHGTKCHTCGKPLSEKGE